MSAILETPRARQVVQKSREQWRQFRAIAKRRSVQKDLFEQPENSKPTPPAPSLENLIRDCIEHANSWKDLAQEVHEMDEQGQIQDSLEVGDKVNPIATTSLALLQEVGKMAADDESVALLRTDLRISIYEMEQVCAYFKSWPCSNSEQDKAIREEIARGEDRTFEEFALEVAQNNSAR